MKKYKAVLLTILFVIVIAAGLIASTWVKTVDLSHSLYDILESGLIAFALCAIIQKFYHLVSR